MASRKQQQLSDYIDAVHGGLFNQNFSLSGWSLLKNKDILDNPPPMPKPKDPSRLDYRVLIPIYGIKYATNPDALKREDAITYKENVDLSIVSNLVKRVLDREPSPNPDELNASLVILCGRFFKDPAHLAGAASIKDYYSTALSFTEKFHPHWDGTIRADIRKVAIDHARRGDPKAKAFYKQMLKSGWVPSGDEIAGEETATWSNLTQSELSHLLDLRERFTSAFNESYSTGNAFRNPLSNLDMAWIYKMSEKDKPGWNDTYVVPFLQYIDRCIAKLHERNIPIANKNTKNK